MSMHWQKRQHMTPWDENGLVYIYIYIYIYSIYILLFLIHNIKYCNIDMMTYSHNAVHLWNLFEKYMGFII